MADFMILAINTLQITSRKKYITDSIRCAYRRFLSSVDTYSSNIQTCIHPTISSSPFKSVNPALSGTQGTVFKNQPVIIVI
jgi:hypothetical protein